MPEKLDLIFFGHLSGGAHAERIIDFKILFRSVKSAINAFNIAIHARQKKKYAPIGIRTGSRFFFIVFNIQKSYLTYFSPYIPFLKSVL